MPIVPLLANAAFDSETTRQLGLAFEAAWQAVKTSESTLGDEFPCRLDPRATRQTRY